MNILSSTTFLLQFLIYPKLQDTKFDAQCIYYDYFLLAISNLLKDEILDLLYSPSVLFISIFINYLKRRNTRFVIQSDYIIYCNFKISYQESYLYAQLSIKTELSVKLLVLKKTTFCYIDPLVQCVL